MSKMMRPLDRAVDLTMRALFETDERKSAELIEASGQAMLDLVDEMSKQRRAATEALLVEAKCALDRAKKARNLRERRRQLRLSELLMASARAE